MSLKDRVVVVTGASGNVGSAVIERLLAEGAKVAGLDRVAHAAMPGYRPYLTDLTAEVEVEATFDQIEQQLGPIWSVLHIAGTWRGGKSVSETDVTLFESMMNINLRSSFLVGRAAMKRLLEHGGGRIVMVGSITAANFSGMSGSGAYNVSKAGVIALTKVLAEEGKDSGVFANAVAPNTIDTPANRKAMPNVESARWVPLSAVAEALIALAQPESGINGSVVTLTGR